jgi:putative ABC transport system permease protein
MSNHMPSLALQTIKGRKAGFVAAFIAIWCAAAMITACGVLVDSGLRAGIPPERYAAAPVVAAADQSLAVPEDTAQRFAERVPVPPADVAKITHVPGVRGAVPDVSVSVGLVAGGRPVADGKPVLAHGWSSTALGPVTLVAGRAPRGPDDVVLDAGLATHVRIGDTVDVTDGGVPTPYHVVGIVSSALLARQSAVYLTDDRIGLAGHVDTVGVLADPGVSADVLAARIADAVPGLRTYTGNDRADAEFLDVGQARSFLIEMSSAFGGTMLMIVVLVVAGTLGLAIQQRRREFALLRAIAATPRQVHRLIGTEILLLGATAAALGALPGYGLAYLLRGLLADTGTIPADFRFAIDPVPGLIAVVACVVSSEVAGLIVSRRAARISPVAALGEAAVEPARLSRVRLAIGWLLVPLGVGAAIAVPLTVAGQAATAGAASSALLLVIAMGLLGPRLLTGTAALFGRLGMGRAAGGFLAGVNTMANARRVSSATTPLIMGVALAAVQIFTLTTTTAAAQHQADTGLVADRVLTGGVDGIAPSVADAVRAVPGVAVVTEVVRTQVVLSYRALGDPEVDSYSAQGVTPGRLASVMNLDVRQGDIDGLTGDTVALSQFAASTVGVGVGGRVTMHLGDGTPIRPRVVAIYANGLGFGDVTLPHDVVIGHTTNRTDTTVLIGLRPHASPDLGAVLRSYPTVAVADRESFTAAQNTALAGQSTVNLVLNLAILAYIAIAVVNTLVLATAARVREFALLRLVGATRRQVRAMMRGEARIVVAAAVVLGSLTALPPLVGVSIGLTRSPLPTISPLAYVAIVATAIGLGWLSITLATRVAMRPRPIDAMGIRE